MGDRVAENTIILNQLPIFSDLQTPEITMLASLFRLRRWPAGEVLFNEGDNSHELIFLVVGVVGIHKKDKAGKLKEIAKIEGKNVIGEAAFVDNSLRSATAIATADSIGLIMSQDALDAITEENPMLALKLVKKLNRLLALKLRKTSREFAEAIAAKS